MSVHAIPVREWGDKKKAAGEALRPVVLVPTPAQLARGERVIDADPEIWPGAVVAMVKRCARRGWEYRVTYSQFLDVPPHQGKYAGQWVTKHCLLVRAWKPNMLGVNGRWDGVEGDGWTPQGAQACTVSWGLSAPFGITGMEKLIDGTMVMTREGLVAV